MGSITRTVTPIPRTATSAALVRPQSLALRYGADPHQTPAQAIVTEVGGGGGVPFKGGSTSRVSFSAPGYINLLDGLNAELIRACERTA